MNKSEAVILNAVKNLSDKILRYAQKKICSPETALSAFFRGSVFTWPISGVCMIHLFLL